MIAIEIAARVYERVMGTRPMPGHEIDPITAAQASIDLGVCFAKALSDNFDEVVASQDAIQEKIDELAGKQNK